MFPWFNKRRSLLATVTVLTFAFNFFSIAPVWAAGEIEISTCQELQAIANNLSEDYILVNDIDCSESETWNEDAGFAPIGALGSEFTGTFNGQGYTITDLEIYRPNQDYVGLFGAIDGAYIENVRLENGSVRGREVVGALAGQVTGLSHIVLVTSDVTVTGGNSLSEPDVEGVGGLIGKSFGDSENTVVIDQVSAFGDVSGVTKIGGLIGWIYHTNLQNVFSQGNVSATGDNVGGLVGWAEEHTIANSYATGEVSGADSVGGLVGRSVNGSIEHSFATGSVESPEAKGGLVGTNLGTISASFWHQTDLNLSCYSGEGGDDGCTAIESSDHPPYFYNSTNPPMDQWNFVEIWTESANNYPNLGAMFSEEPLEEPLAPANLTLFGTDTTVTFEWDDVENNNGYVVDVVPGSDSSTFPSSNEENFESPDLTTAQWTGLTPNTQYIARVGAYNESGTSYSEIGPFYTLASVPTSVSGTAASASSINLSWSGNGTSYTVTNTTLSTSSTASGTSTTITGLECGTNYTFQVRALNGDDIASAASQGVTVKTLSCPPGGGGGGGSSGSSGGTSVPSTTNENAQNTAPQNNQENSSQGTQTGDAGALSSPTTALPDSDFPFIDVKNHWSFPFVRELYDGGLMQGKSENIFDPDGLVTRAELVKIAALAFDYPIISDLSNLEQYSDIDKNSEFSPYIATLTEAGVVEGYKHDGTFKSNAWVSRAEALKIILLSSKQEVKDFQSSSFSDVFPNDWFKKYVDFAFTKGVVSGKTAKLFAPNDLITRAEAAKIVMKVKNL